MAPECSTNYDRDDGVVCNGKVCTASMCDFGIPQVCDDWNACTADSCDPKSGCVNAAPLYGASCGDGDGPTDEPVENTKKDKGNNNKNK